MSQLTKVQFKATERNMLAGAEKLDDKYFFIRLNTISKADDAIANDVIYHNLCWAKAKKKAFPKSNPAESF